MGAAVVLGWVFGVPALKSVLPGAVQMKANAALCVMAAATCLLLRTVRARRGADLAARVLALLVMMVGALTLFEYLFDTALGIDELLFRDLDARYAAVPGRMSPYSTVAIIGLGVALAVPRRDAWHAAVYLGTVITATIGLTVLLGYVWNAKELTTDQWLPPVAIHTGLSFLLLSVATVLSSGLIRSRSALQLQEKRSGVEAKVMYGFVGALALLCLGGGISYRMQINFDNTEQLIAEGNAARTSLETLYGSVSDAESAQRDYLLLGGTEHEAQFLGFQAQVGSGLRLLRRSYAGNPEQTALIDQLESQIGARMQSLTREMGMPKPSRLLDDGLGEMVTIRNTIARIDKVDAAQLAARTKWLARNRSYTLLASLSTLSIATAALLTLFGSIVRDIRERARISEQLQTAQRDAQRATLAKSEFLAAMSHEIRTPMNGVIGMLELLQQSSLMGQQQEMVQLTRESADALLTIIDDILDFSKIEAGHLRIENAQLSVCEVVEKTCALLNRLAEHKQTVLISFCDPRIPLQLVGDETRLRQILVNLINNAIKFSSGQGRCGRVAVRAQLAQLGADEAIVEFSVSDNGIGMDPATVSRLFTSFMQADVSTTRRYGGTGLGLAICKQLTGLMRGSISVRSEPQTGSTFTVRLPFSGAQQTQAPRTDVAELPCLVVGGELGLADDLATYLESAGARVKRVPDQAAINDWSQGQPPGVAVCVLEAGDELPDIAQLYASVPARADLSLRTVVVLIGRAIRNPRADAEGFIVIDGNALPRQTLIEAVALAAGKAVAPSTAAPAPSRLELAVRQTREEAIRAGRLILVAEDNDINQKVISQQLSLLGYRAEVVSNGRQAYQRWQSGQYGLLLADLHMPEMDGYALTLQIRLQERGRSRTPIVALTANALAGESERCRAVGMDDYLSKPASLAAMGAVLSRWLPRTDADTIQSVTPIAVAASSFDVQVLESLIGSDPQLIAEVLVDFELSARQMSQQLLDCYRSGDLCEMASTAHKFKSSAASMGAARVANLCAAMELASRSEDSGPLPELVGAFQTEMGALLSQLQSHLSPGSEQLRAASGAA